MSNSSIHLDEKRFKPDEIERVRRAEIVAAEAHDGQLRKSGQPFVSHPIAVAQALADWGMDGETIVAGLLHDAVEDTGLTLSDIETGFGPNVAHLVDGVTKLNQVEWVPVSESTLERQNRSAENLRKLLLAMADDLRVIIIKLADRRHNLMTLQFLLPEKQQRLASESLEIFAPLADRLGMGQLKCEIEDLSFRYVMPEEYQKVRQLMSGYARRSSRYIERMRTFMEEKLRSEGVELLSIEGRQKHLYSVHKKLRKSDGDIDKIYDLIALRVIVADDSDCYKALGVLHQYFKPLIYRIKDYIAVPKPNGYRSLHTTVFGLDGRITEIQIRTPKMHEEAERGLAAHFYYDAQKSGRGYMDHEVSSLPKSLQWVSQLSDLGNAAKSTSELVEVLKVDLFHDRIFAFSPKGDLYDLPEGSTPVDFAFAVHSDIGLRARGAKVNGRMVTLDHKLENRDVVEIITRKTPNARRDWLNFVKTPHARNRIRSWLRSTDGDGIVAGRS